MKFSGSSGVRMIWSKDLLDFAYILGLRLGNGFEDVVIASDFRESSDSLVSVLSGAIMAGGADVYYGGRVPTPTLAYGTKRHGAGVMVTASHNPPEYNGIKLWNKDGSAFTDEQWYDLESKGKVKDWDSLGKYKKENILELHREALLREFKELNLNVIIDCSNGAGSVITPFLLRELGAQVTSLNCYPSGLFSAHPSEPNERNLEVLRRMVIKKKADLGIAHDGDADRFIAVTSSGRYLNGDYILAIFTKALGIKKIVVPVDSSMLLENFAEVVRCKVGDANVSQRMKELKVEFGGESSGTQIFASWRYTPDAIYAVLKFAEILQNEDIDELIAEFPRYYTLRKSVYYKDRDEIVGKIEALVSEYEVERIDGYRVSMDDGWFLIRFSGTEPKVRITVEFEEEKMSRKVLDKIVKFLS